jgi:hypothetical protein
MNDLQRFYVKGKARLMAYEAMAEAVLAGAQTAQRPRRRRER